MKINRTIPGLNCEWVVETDFEGGRLRLGRKGRGEGKGWYLCKGGKMFQEFLGSMQKNFPIIAG